MVRLCRFYEQLGVDKQTELCQTVYKIVTGRPDHLCSFVDDEKTFGPDTKLAGASSRSHSAQLDLSLSPVQPNLPLEVFRRCSS